MNNGLMNKDLYHRIVFVRFKKHFPNIEKNSLEEQVNDYFKLRDKINIYCAYCETELKPNQPYPYSASPSLDHKIPKSKGGLNLFYNIAITCTKCNIVKGTLTTEEYLKMLELLSVEPEWQDKIITGLFWGRKKNMLERKKKENKKPRMLHDYV